MPKKPQAPRAMYQLKIVLLGSKPSIWRRILVPGQVKLSRLHDILQIVMGWTNSHLHQFHAESGIYCLNVEDNFGDLEKHDERRFSVADVVPREKTWFIYEYDFGDGWEHEVRVEKILPGEIGERTASCLQGKNACPPEDCGGIPGYYRILEITGNPQHSEHEELTAWLGSDFDPRHFDPEEINAALKRLKI